MSIKAKLLISLSAILLSAFIATSVVNYVIAREAVREELLNSSLPLTGKNIYSDIHTALMRPILVASSMATDTFLKNWIEDGEQDLGSIQDYLAEIQEQYGFLTAFFVSSATDKYYYPGGMLKKVSPREPRDIWYYAFIQSKKPYDLNVDVSMQDKDALTIFINYRITDDRGNLLGAVGVGVNMDRAVSLLKSAQNEYHRSVYLVDQDGLIQVHPDRKRIKHDYITETPGIREVAGEILTPRGKAVSFEYDRDDRHYLLSTRYIPEFEWHLIVEQEESTALVTARQNMIRTLVVGALASLLIIFLSGVTINHFQTRLERMAKTDPLTGAANRRTLEESFVLAQYKATRYDAPFTIILVDLDNFKEINDRDGHVAGDTVLTSVAHSIAGTLRPDALLARWGGDEFVVLLPGSANEAMALADRIRSVIADAPVSLSCGVAQFNGDDTLDSLIHRADQCMYKAKARGGDCVISA